MSKFDAKHDRKRHRERRKMHTHGKGERKRDNVVMVRVDADNLNRIDELVETGQFNSRSDATAFLIGEGIKSKQQMFEKMAEKVSQIQGLRAELEVMIAEDTKPSESVGQNADETSNQEGVSQ